MARGSGGSACVPLRRGGARATGEHGEEALEGAVDVAPEIHTKHVPPVRRQRLGVCGGLRGLERAEAVARAGHRHVDGILGRELHHRERRRPAFVELPRRMEESRPVALRRGDAEVAPDPQAHFGEELVRFTFGATYAASVTYRRPVPCASARQSAAGSSGSSMPCTGPAPADRRPGSARMRAVCVFVSCTSGWSKGLLTSRWLATAVAISQRTNSPAMSYASLSRSVTTGWPAFTSDASERPLPLPTCMPTTIRSLP